MKKGENPLGILNIVFVLGRKEREHGVGGFVYRTQCRTCGVL